MATVQELEQQRSRDLRLARASSNPAGRAHDLAQARTLGGQIRTMQRANQGASTSTTATSTPTTQATDPNASINADAQNASLANASISSTLGGLGLGAMTTWATNLVSALAGQGIDSGTIVSTVLSNLNTATNADGSVDQGALDAFNAALPGFNQLIKNTGSNGSPGSSPAQAIANYINYGTQVQQFATQAGLLPGTVTPQTIGNLWANQVSSTEVSQRITDATNVANNAPQQVKDYLSQNFGMSPAALTSYYLNPENTLNTIQTNINTGMVGGEANITGFGPLSVAQSQALGAFLSNGTGGASGSEVGTVNPVSAGNANAFFTNNLSSSTSGAVTGSLNQLTGLQDATAGQVGGTVTADQLIAAGEGQTQAVNAVSQAQQKRTASSVGGGGAATTAQGSVGLGYAQS